MSDAENQCQAPDWGGVDTTWRRLAISFCWVAGMAVLKRRLIVWPTPTVAPSPGVAAVVFAEVVGALVCEPSAPAARATTWYLAAGSRPSVAVQLRRLVESCPGTVSPLPTLVTTTEVRLPALLVTTTGASRETPAAWSAGEMATSGGAATETAFTGALPPAGALAAEGMLHPASTLTPPSRAASTRGRCEVIEFNRTMRSRIGCRASA